MEPMRSNSVSVQVNPLHGDQSSKTDQSKQSVQRSSSLLNLQASRTDKKLNRRITPSSRTLRAGLKDTLNAFEEADAKEKKAADNIPQLKEKSISVSLSLPAPETSRLESPRISSVQSTPRLNPVPSVIERINFVLAEQEKNGIFKRKNEYALTLVSSNIFYWKKYTFLKELMGSDRKATKDTLNYLYDESLVQFTKNSDSLTYQVWLNIYKRLKENDVCKKVLEDNPELNSKYTKLLQSIAEKEEKQQRSKI